MSNRKEVDEAFLVVRIASSAEILARRPESLQNAKSLIIWAGVVLSVDAGVQHAWDEGNWDLASQVASKVASRKMNALPT